MKGKGGRWFPPSHGFMPGKAERGKGEWYGPPPSHPPSGYMPDWGKGDWGKGDWGKGDWGKGDWIMPGKGMPSKGKGDRFIPVPGDRFMPVPGDRFIRGKGHGGGDAQSEGFLARHNIEAHAADEFRQLPPNLQRAVIDVGSLADARDPTAVLISRMKKANQGSLKVVDRKPGDWSCPACGDLNFARNPICRKCSTPSTQDFLTKNNVEAHAIEAFQQLPPEMQCMVMDAGTLNDARDATAVLMSRISKAQQGQLKVQIKPGDWRCPGCGELNFARNATCRKCGTPQAEQKVDMMSLKRSADSSAYTPSPAAKLRRTTSVSRSMVEEYLKRNGIQEHVAEDFMALSADLQSLVIDAGSLVDARDPTAVLISRMKKAKHGTLQAMQMKPGDWKCASCGELNFSKNTECRSCGRPQEGNVALSQTETFLKENNIEDHAAEKFRALPLRLQDLVMDAGTLASARDPTAVLFSRMAKATSGELKPAPVRAGDWACPKCGEHNFARNDACRQCGFPKVEALPDLGAGYEDIAEEDLAEEMDLFLARNQVEAHAIEALSQLPGGLQKVIMDVGGLSDARDPTAVLMSRIKKAKTGQLKAVKTRPGDWKCPSCGDLNFARNTECRKCGEPQPSAL